MTWIEICLLLSKFVNYIVFQRLEQKWKQKTGCNMLQPSQFFFATGFSFLAARKAQIFVASDLRPLGGRRQGGIRLAGHQAVVHRIQRISDGPQVKMNRIGET